MDIIGAGLGITTDFVPVPGLKTAFAIIQSIWDNVQKVCLNGTNVFDLGVDNNMTLGLKQQGVFVKLGCL